MQVFTVTYKLEVSQLAESKLATIIIDSQMLRFIRATSFSFPSRSWKIFSDPGATFEIESVIFVPNLVVFLILPVVDWWKYCVEIPKTNIIPLGNYAIKF